MCGPQNSEFRPIGSSLEPRAAVLNFSQNPRNSNLKELLWFWLLFLFTFLGNISPATSGLSLSEHIQHFEPVFYDLSGLKEHHHRAKREATHTVSLDFTAHNREFKIRLQRDRSIFADDVVFESTDGTLNFDFGKVYSGTLEDDEQVEVHGLVTKDGVFDGHVSTPNELYYLEPADRYFESPDFHSVMYKASDVVHPRPARCASQQLHLRDRVLNPWVTSPPPTQQKEEENYGGFYEPLGKPESAVGSLEPSPFHPTSPSNSSKVENSRVWEGDREDRYHHPVHPKLKAVKTSTNNQLYSSSDMKMRPGPSPPRKAPAGGAEPLENTRDSPFSDHLAHSPIDDHNYLSSSTFKSFSERFSNRRRYKRSIIDPKKTTCMLYLQADHLFFRQEGTEEACIDKITRHVQRVNNIYKVTDFDRDGKEDRIGFMIKRIKIHTENATRDPSYRFPGNYGVEKFLELFSEEDYDAFCLAYMFTYRDFEGGTLGLAWTGDLKNAGGVCEKNGHYRGSLKSLNTGIVTLLNYGKKVPPAVSHVTLAHEIGHNFGSPHDPEKDMTCTPGGEDGNYIMFARATSGDKQNNNKFSPCSLKQINSVLNSKARDAKGCFTEPQVSICGNGVVEEGEECDCGWQEDCEESCCFPMMSNPPRNHRPCNLRPRKVCSPSQGPCCTRDCEVKQGDLCREDNGCRDASFCDGFSPYCPPSINKPNKTICKDEFVCFKGECTGSICIAYGLDSCQCQRKSGDADTKSCELCCKLPGEDQPCLSSFEWNIPPYNIPDMYAKPGTPCDDYKGYCDVFQKCREVDPSGPLATLRKILLSNESLATIHRWVIDHWYAVFFVVLALIIILVITTKLFGRQAKLHSNKRPQKKCKKRKKSSTTTSKKKKTIVHKNGSTNGHFVPNTNGTNPEGANHVVHPTVVRANIPFKRRVNEVRRAATKAKRVARSQLGKPYKKPSTPKRTDGAVTSPTESEKSLNNIPNGKTPTSTQKPREKTTISSRFSIISFKPFKPKAISPDKSKAKVYDKRKSGIAGGRRSKSKPQPQPQLRSKSPDKKRKSFHGDKGDNPEKEVRSRSPSKRMTLEDERRKSKIKPYGPRSSSPDKSRKYRPKSPERVPKLTDGNWLINKFLADEEKIAKPVVVGSLAGSLNGSLGSVNGTPNGSPIISHNRNGSTRALIPPSHHASPIRGIVNEAFIGSPRNARTHSSLRVTKSTSPEEVDVNIHIHPCKYRRSISMVAYNKGSQLASPDKRKRSTLDEGFLEKRRRCSSPEKPLRFSSSPETEKGESLAPSSDKSKAPPVASQHKSRRRNSSSLPSSVSSSNHSFASVPDKIRQKLSLITASPEGSMTSIVVPEEVIKEKVSECSQPKTSSVVPKLPPKDWV